MSNENNEKVTKKEVQHRRFEGEVLSTVEDKTIHVLVTITKWHDKYKKQYKVNKKYAVHDEKNIAKVGDDVIFEECRPYSKTKKWRLVKVIN